MSKSVNEYSAKGEVSNVYVKRTFLQRSLIYLGKAPFTAWLGMIIVSTYFFVAILIKGGQWNEGGEGRGHCRRPLTPREIIQPPHKKNILHARGTPRIGASPP